MTKKASLKNIRIKAKKIKFAKGGKDAGVKGGKGGSFPAGGGIQAASSPPKKLANCQSVRIFTNNTKGGNNVDRTIDVEPVAGAGWSAGSTITVFVGEPKNQGNPPPSAPPAGASDPWTIDPQGEAAIMTVPPGKSVFVHYKMPQGTNNPEVNALITQS